MNRVTLQQMLSMGLGDVHEQSDDVTILRVPGGWIYFQNLTPRIDVYGINNDVHIKELHSGASGVFVPEPANPT